MRGFGVLVVLLGIAFVVLPLLNFRPAPLMNLGDFRPIAAAILILIGGGLFFFSSYD